MLVLARKRNEKIIIGDGEATIEIIVVEIRGDKVRLGVTASPKTPVHREEVKVAIAASLVAEAKNGTAQQQLAQKREQLCQLAEEINNRTEEEHRIGRTDVGLNGLFIEIGVLRGQICSLEEAIKRAN